MSKKGQKSLERNRQRDPKTRDINKSKEESPTENEEHGGEPIEIKLMRSRIGAISRPKMEIPTYSGSLGSEELINWINALDNHFEYAEVVEDK